MLKINNITCTTFAASFHELVVVPGYLFLAICYVPVLDCLRVNYNGIIYLNVTHHVDIRNIDSTYIILVCDMVTLFQIL